MAKLPHIKKPCSNCPFRKDAPEGWLGAARMAEIVAAESFVCHKTLGERNSQQCAGHMLLNGMDNVFVRLAACMHINLELSGRDQVFDTKADCIEHHAA